MIGRTGALPEGRATGQRGSRQRWRALGAALATLAALTVGTATSAAGTQAGAAGQMGQQPQEPGQTGSQPVAPVDPNQAGVDQFPSVGRVNMTTQFPGQSERTDDVTVVSRPDRPARVNRGPLADGTIPTEIVQMQLQGEHPQLGQIIVNVGRDFGLPPSNGQVQNVTLDNGALTSGDSFFDVFFEIVVEMPGVPPEQGVAIARNEQPIRMSSRIFDLPPNRPKETPDQAFEIDHMKCYRVRRLGRGRARLQRVQLTDQIERERRTSVRSPTLLCNPVTKGASRARNTQAHLVCYPLSTRRRKLDREPLGIKNQFGTEVVDLTARDTLCVAATKRHLRGKRRRFPRTRAKRISHMKCYRVKRRETVQDRRERLTDQFERHTARVREPRHVCAPVSKRHRNRVTGIVNDEAHLTCYRITGGVSPRIVSVRSQFGTERLRVLRRESLCVPTHKTRCSEYAEDAKVALNNLAGQRVGTVNKAVHVPFENDPLSDCPGRNDKLP